MKDNIIKSISCHPDKDEIIAKLVLNISPSDINKWLKYKYKETKSTQLIIGIASLKKFKDEYLDMYNIVKQDIMQEYSNYRSNIEQDPKKLVQSNSAYRDKLQEYINTEVDIKVLIKNLIVASEFRIEQIYNIIQSNPNNTKPDYVILQWIQTITNLLEKQDTIINGSPDKIIQQNTINIQILDQHIGVFSKVIREVISRLDYDTSLLFVDILNEELKKLKEPTETTLSVDARLIEARRLEDQVSVQLDIPSA